MKRVHDDDGHEHVEATPTEARQAEYGRPVLYVLVGVLIGAVVSLSAIYAYFA